MAFHKATRIWYCKGGKGKGLGMNRTFPEPRSTKRSHTIPRTRLSNRTMSRASRHKFNTDNADVDSAAGTLLPINLQFAVLTWAVTRHY